MAGRRRKDSAHAKFPAGKVVMVAKSEPRPPKRLGAFSSLGVRRAACLPRHESTGAISPEVGLSLQALVDGTSNDGVFSAQPSESPPASPADAPLVGRRCPGCFVEGASDDACAVATWDTVASTPTAKGGIICAEPGCTSAVCTAHALSYRLPCQEGFCHQKVALAPAVTKLGELSRWGHAHALLLQFEQASPEALLHEAARAVGERLCACEPATVQSLVSGVTGVFQWFSDASLALTSAISSRKYVMDAVARGAVAPDLKYHPEKILVGSITAPRNFRGDFGHVREPASKLHRLVETAVSDLQMTSLASKKAARGRPAASRSAHLAAPTCSSAPVSRVLVDMWLNSPQHDRDTFTDLLGDSHRFAEIVFLQIISGLEGIDVYGSAAAPLAAVQALCPESAPASLPGTVAAATVLKCHGLLSKKNADTADELIGALIPETNFFS